jgi:hypothetical protein
MTLKQAKAVAKALDITISGKNASGEYRVNFVNGKEATAYYTNDLEDAVGTAKAMHDHALAHS